MDSTLGIIGTAGRGTDKDKLDVKYWNLMNVISNTVRVSLGCNHLVSGGAAWADHCAVQLFLRNKCDKLFLHFPCEFHKEFNGGQDGKIASYYHTKFSEKVGVDTFFQITNALSQGADSFVTPGFKNRNSKVAEYADHLLAFTFGDGPVLKDGGTSDTMNKFLKLKKGRGFHFDLNSKELFELT